MVGRNIMNDLAEMFIYLVLAITGFISLLWLAQVVFGSFLKLGRAGISRTLDKITLIV